jgi:hypothetical protein
LQIPLRTQSTVEAYIANREWRDAHLSACPLHPSGGCSFSRHGSYARAAPQGLRIARWYCPEARQTFSLLPDFLAARLPGLLDTIQTCVVAVQSARSLEAAADLVRGPEVTLPGAVRWLRRRVQGVRTGIAAVSNLMPELPVNVGIGQTGFLCALRRLLPMTVLTYVPAPLGFGPRCQIGNAHDQHEVGPDQRAWSEYGGASCDANRHHRCQRQQSPRRTTCSGSGARTAASGMPAPTITFDGSSGFASISIALDWRNGRS